MKCEAALESFEIWTKHKNEGFSLWWTNKFESAAENTIDAYDKWIIKQDVGILVGEQKLRTLPLDDRHVFHADGEMYIGYMLRKLPRGTKRIWNIYTLKTKHSLVEIKANDPQRETKVMRGHSNR